MSDQLYVLVTVTLLDGCEVHSDDANDDGSDGIGGFYGFAMNPVDVAQRVSVGGEDNVIEAALDLFHDNIGIAELDNYEIDARQISDPAEAPDETSWR